MKKLPHNAGLESRWPPALAILVVLGLVGILPHHVRTMPVWVAYIAAATIVIPMAFVTFSVIARQFWLVAERTMILLFGAAYVVNTAAELGDMIGIITLHPPETRSISLLSSSLAIWVTNVLAFSLLYWQIDRGGPSARHDNTPALSRIGSFPRLPHPRCPFMAGSRCFLIICSSGSIPQPRSAPPILYRSQDGPKC